MTIRLGFTPDEVRLEWTGGTPPFSVYRSGSPANVTDPANKVGETAGRTWLDFPPPADIQYYAVTSPCVPQTEICDGRDNDCDGEVDEDCVPGCMDHADCATEEFCDASGLCLPDEQDGGACAEPAECLSGHCQNGYCCAGGDCCATSTDCAAYTSPAECQEPASCQGSRVDGICSASFQCAGQSVPDDSACSGLESNMCGPYPSVFCTGDAEQPVDQAARCSSSCTTDDGCDQAAHCDNNVCLADVAQGGFCDEPSDCISGLFCTDGVCCGSSCEGICQACNLPGLEGTCANVPLGQDPDAECSALSCAGYYWGWVGDTCYLRADVPAEAASCDGAGACRSTAQECPVSGQGLAHLTCDSFCQDPTAGSCTGTVAGSCTNVNQGNETCGQGVCQVTEPRCINGSPNTCEPNSGATSPEMCNDLDDNCDSFIDNGSFSDGFEPNNSCADVRILPSVGSNQTQTVSTATLYPSGDSDYYRIVAVETDSTCQCCDLFCLDEDFQLRIDLTVPSGAGSYQFCTGNSCAGVTTFCQTVFAGQTLSWIWTFDGSCFSQDVNTHYVLIRSGNSPGFECLPYTLRYTYRPGCF
ncbi:MAG: MopE-related protein [Acidobacteriota bacterium]